MVRGEVAAGRGGATLLLRWELPAASGVSLALLALLEIALYCTVRAMQKHAFSCQLFQQKPLNEPIFQGFALSYTPDRFFGGGSTSFMATGLFSVVSMSSFSIFII